MSLSALLRTETTSRVRARNCSKKVEIATSPSSAPLLRCLVASSEVVWRGIIGSPRKRRRWSSSKQCLCIAVCAVTSSFRWWTWKSNRAATEPKLLGLLCKRTSSYDRPDRLCRGHCLFLSSGKFCTSSKSVEGPKPRRTPCWHSRWLSQG